MASSKPVLSFAAIVQGRDSSARVTDDGLVDLVDLVMVATGKNCNDANEVLRDLKPSLFNKDRILMRGKRRYVTLRDAITLIMVLPGKMATELRRQFAVIIEDYIHENLCHGSGQDTSGQAGFKRKREQVELLKLEEEIKVMTQSRILEAAEKLERIRNPSIPSFLDERTRLMLQDCLQNSILNTSLTSGQGNAATDGLLSSKPISIGSIAKELGYNPTTSDAKRIGLDLRKRYIQHYGKPPPKHDQLCDGRVTLVNSYNEQDRPLVEEALHAYFRPCENSDGEDNE